MSVEAAVALEKAPAPSAQLDPLLGVYRPAAPIFVAGRGSYVIAEDGREYLDFASGIGVNALGYGDPGVLRALQEAASTGLFHTSNLYRTRPAAELARMLVEHSFPGQVFFCNSGAEANEAAFKFARRAARESGGPGKHEIVALQGSFHGRLFGSLAATDRPPIREPFEPVMPGVTFIPVGDEAAARTAITRDRTAAVIAEPVQGEGGVRPVDFDFLRLLRELADEAEAALIFDEVQCGLGRTGELFAYQRAEVVPDILTLAKPLAGGLPMGAVVVGASVARHVKPGDHATTFGGGPVVASVAMEVVRRIADPGFLGEVQRKSKVLEGLLRSLDSGLVREIRGCGLMWGIELWKAAAPVVARALDLGLLVTAAGERVVRLLPPLTVDDADLELGAARLREALADYSG